MRHYYLMLFIVVAAARFDEIKTCSIQVSLETLSGPEQLLAAIEDSLSHSEVIRDDKDTALNAILKNGSTNKNVAVSLESVRLISAVQGAIPPVLREAVWRSLNFCNVGMLSSNEDVDSLLYGGNLEALSSLKTLDISGSGISSLPGEAITSLRNLEHLDISKNALSILPKEIGKLKKLKTLLVKENNVTILPGELSKCEALECLDLSSNRLSSILISFRNLTNLVSLLLDDNPLESFPDLSCCLSLKKLSFCRVMIESDDEPNTKVVCSFDAKQSSKSLVISFFGTNESDPIQAFYDLALRGSNHHPLVIQGICIMLGNSNYRNAFLSNSQAIDKISLMVLSENILLVKTACKVLSLLSECDRSAANKILSNHGDILFSLLKSDADRKIAVLNTIETATRFCSFTDSFIGKLVDLSLASLDDPGNLLTQVILLRVLGNLALQKDGKILLSSNTTFIHKIKKIAEDGSKQNDALYLASCRLLSSLGLHGLSFSRQRRLQEIQRGKRILSLDGGGMKGLATVRLLKKIEIQAGQPLQELFDLVVGTSTGALLAVALMLKGMSLEECEAVYKEMGRKVFQHPVHSSENDESWMSVFYRSLHMKTEHVRAVVVGCKHDTEVYEQMLKEKCFIPSVGPYKIESLIDTSALKVPKIALVSTLTSVSPAQPFVFRNYEYCSTTNNDERIGSCSNALWEAVRASSAAIYYLDSFECGGKKFQDGALVANNPSLIALQEAHHLWPKEKIELLVSVGTGSSPVCERPEGISSYIETGSALLESATNVEEVHRALEVISNLLPGLQYYRLNPVDVRCEMELDCVDPGKWKDLESAADEYAEKASDTYRKIVESMNL